MRRSILTFLAVASAVVASPALAGKDSKNTLPPPAEGTYLGGCDKNLTDPNAIACQGYYEKNVFGGSEDKRDIQADAILALTGSNDLFDGSQEAWDAIIANGYKLEADGGDTAFDFGTELFGQVVIGAHFGNVDGNNDQYGNVSVFYLFDFGTEGGFVTLDNIQGWSNAVLYIGDQPPAVPEPATWAMMLLGFGAAGTAMRRSRRRNGQISQLA